MLPGEGDQVRLPPPPRARTAPGQKDPLAARVGELGRNAGKAAATWVFDGNAPEEAYRRVLDAPEPAAIGPRTGYDQDDLARDLGLEPGDPVLQDAAPAYADAFAGGFWEVELAAREHTS